MTTQKTKKQAPGEERFVASGKGIKVLKKAAGKAGAKKAASKTGMTKSTGKTGGRKGC